jgi:hypothetical protein
MAQALFALAVTPYRVAELVVVAATLLLIYGIMRQARPSRSARGFLGLILACFFALFAYQTLV